MIIENVKKMRVAMWENLPIDQKKNYQKVICFFSSLTPLFSQKHTDDTTYTPYINSKFQEKIFQVSFNATAEDLGNTSYDASVTVQTEDGYKIRYLVGIKSFIYNEKGQSGGGQKVAQFKSNNQAWAKLVASIKVKGSKEETDISNHEIYKQLAEEVSKIRNERISSSEANLKGFTIDLNDSHEKVEAVYHVLMPTVVDNQSPAIYVGETSYTKIDLDNIKVIGCTSLKSPQNFEFEDGKHKYKYTPADCQLYMYFDQPDLIREKWTVTYIDDAYELFSKLADSINNGSDLIPFTKSTTTTTENEVKITDSVSWSLINNKNKVEKFSGFNSFYGVGSKLGKDSRKRVIQTIISDFKISDNTNEFSIAQDLERFLCDESLDKDEKVLLRDDIRNRLNSVLNEEFVNTVKRYLYRPQDEMYIPIPKSKFFHEKYPNFFAEGAGTFVPGTSKLALLPEERSFNLVFEPSGKTIRSFITQDAGKAIESCESQSYLGEWILKGIFQLKDYEPLTKEKLDEIGINGIRLYKTNINNDVHLEFIYIDKEQPPKDLLNL